jgi:H+-transporting ATPase
MAVAQAAAAVNANLTTGLTSANETIGNVLIVLAVALAVLLVSVQLSRGAGVLRIAEFALLLLVAAIPVAMPAVSC